jgi:hypothetical protein
MPSVGFEPATPASKRPQTHALDRTATGIGPAIFSDQKFSAHIIMSEAQVWRNYKKQTALR